MIGAATGDVLIELGRAGPAAFLAIEAIEDPAGGSVDEATACYKRVKLARLKIGIAPNTDHM